MDPRFLVFAPDNPHRVIGRRINDEAKELIGQENLDRLRAAGLCVTSFTKVLEQFWAPLIPEEEHPMPEFSDQAQKAKREFIESLDPCAFGSYRDYDTLTYAESFIEQMADDGLTYRQATRLCKFMNHILEERYKHTIINRDLTNLEPSS